MPRALGVAVTPLQLLIYAGAAAATVAAVLLGGSIGFVGMMAPHALRLLGVHEHRALLPAAALAFLASYSGARLVSYIPVQYMKPAMLAIMAVMFVYTFCKKDLGQAVRTTALSRKETAWGLFFGALIGFYDGVFGPGTGSLLAFIFVRFFAYDFLTATASAKVINLTTNLAALSFFVPNGHIVWAWALPLALANLSGGLVGAHLAMRGGSKFLRYGFMALLCIMIGKFGWDLLH